MSLKKAQLQQAIEERRQQIERLRAQRKTLDEQHSKHRALGIRRQGLRVNRWSGRNTATDRACSGYSAKRPRQVLGGTFDAAIPTIVLICAIAVVLAVGFVVLVLVAD
jgi:hypothetical protein